MPNPVRTQAECTAFFDRFLHPLRKARLLQETLDRFQSTDVVVQEHGDVNLNTSGWSLSGVKLNEDTDADGLIYVRLVANVGDWDITLYKATGGGAGDAICAATAVADGAVATLTASN